MENKEKNIPESALRLKYTREYFKLKQKDFADSLGFQNSYISAIEAGDRNISHKVLVSLANVYNISPTWVLLGKGEMFLNDVDNSKNNPGLDPGLKKLIWYCENSQFVKHTVLGYFLRLLRTDKTIIEDDIKINLSSQDSETTGNKTMDKEELNHDANQNKAQGLLPHKKIKKTNTG
ncbi:MAG: helix-turn-helix transcriptional regulator [Candidatus Aminicenantes bacterium]|jgi:transcriptional regulator with XRE-family HTH domain